MKFSNFLLIALASAGFASAQSTTAAAPSTTAAAATVTATVTTTNAPTAAVTTTAAVTSVVPSSPATCKAALLAVRTQSQICGYSSVNATVTVAPSTAAPTANGLTPAQNAAVASAQQTANNICSKQNCFNTLLADVKQAANLCWNHWGSYEVLDYLEDFRQLNTFLAIGCSTDANGNYCLPQFLTSVYQAENQQLSVFNGFDPLRPKPGQFIPTATLNNVCSTCALKVANAVSSLNSNVGSNFLSATAAALQVLCVQDPNNAGQYCVNTLATLPTTAPPMGNVTNPTNNNNNNNRNSESWRQSVTETMCSPCYRLVYNKIAAASNFDNTIAGAIVTNDNNNLLDAICAVNPSNGKRCAAAVNELYNGLVYQLAVDCARLFLLGGTCPHKCAQDIAQLVNADGCCLGTFLNAFQASIPQLLNIRVNPSTAAPTSATTAAPGTVVQPTVGSLASVFTNCNATTAQLSPCPNSAQPQVFSLVVLNLNYQFYLNNKALVTSSLTQDIANAAAVSTSSVTLSISNRGDGTVSIKAWVVGASQLDQQAIQNSLNTQLQQGGVPLPGTATTVANDPTNTATNNPASAILATSPTSTPTGAASGLQVAFAPLLLLAATAVLLQ